MDWRAVVVRKRAERESRLPKEWLVPEAELPEEGVKDVARLCAERGWLSKEELDITDSSVVQLASDLARGAWSAVEVVKAFAHRATVAQQLVNPYVSWSMSFAWG